MANKEDNRLTSNSGQTHSSMDKVGTQKDKLPTKKLSHGSNLNAFAYMKHLTLALNAAAKMREYRI